MIRPNASVEKVYLYPKPVDFRKSIDGLAALVELDIKVAVFDPVLFVFLNRQRNRIRVLYWERNGFCLWLKRLESERFKTSPDEPDEAIVLTVQELNWLLDGFDLWRNRPHQVLTPRFVAWLGIIRAMIPLPDDLPDDPVLLKQLLAQLMIERTVDKGHIVDLKEQITLLRDRLFNRKSEQTVDPNTPQLAMFNEPESEPLLAVVDDADEEVVAPVKRRGKRKPLSAELPRIEVIHDPRARADLRLWLPQACHWRRNQRTVGYRADADPRDQTCAQGLRLPWVRNHPRHR